MRGWARGVKGSQRYGFPAIERISHGGKSDSIRNTVNAIVIAL